MLKIWNAANFRRTLGGICLIAAPLLFAFVEITAPPSGDSPAAMIANGVRYHDRLALYAYLGLFAGILFIAAIIAALHVVRTTGVVLGHAGAILAMVGNAISGIGLFGLQLAIYMMTVPGVDPKAATAIIERSFQDPVGLSIPLSHDLFAAGMVLLGVAVWRSGFGYRWAGLVAAAGIVVDVAGGMLGLDATPVGAAILSAVSDTGFVLGFAAIGWKVLTTSDTDWVALPERPVRSARSTVAAQA
jgi:hypothetical protein